MQIGLQDIRRLGNRKIMGFFLRDSDNCSAMAGRLEDLCYEFEDLKVSAYSLPRRWNDIKDCVFEKYMGFYKFALTCEPMLGSIDVDNVCQRKFRNTWEATWKNIASDFELSDDLRSIFSDFGLKLVYILQDANFEDDDLLLEIVSFYDTLLLWSVFCKCEDNFRKNGCTVNEILLNLIELDSENFLQYVYKLV